MALWLFSPRNSDLASAKLLELCSSWGTSPSAPQQPPTGAVPYGAVQCHLLTWGDSAVSHGGTQPALHSPCSECDCGFGAGKRG